MKHLRIFKTMLALMASVYASCVFSQESDGLEEAYQYCNKYKSTECYIVVDKAHYFDVKAVAKCWTLEGVGGLCLAFIANKRYRKEVMDHCTEQARSTSTYYRNQEILDCLGKTGRRVPRMIDTSGIFEVLDQLVAGLADDDIFKSDLTALASKLRSGDRHDAYELVEIIETGLAKDDFGSCALTGAPGCLALLALRNDIAIVTEI